MLRPTSRLASGRSFDASIALLQVGHRHLAEALEGRAPGPSRWCRCRRRRAMRPSSRNSRTRARRSPRCPSPRATRSARCAPDCWYGHCEVDAAGVALALGPHQRALPGARARRRERPRPRSASGRSASTGPDDLGDDVAGPADDHGVAGPHVLGPHLVLVVERRLARRWRRRRTPARAGRTAWPGRCDRPTRGCRAAWWCAPRAGTCRRSPTGAPGCVKPSSPRRARSSTFTTTPSIS